MLPNEACWTDGDERRVGDALYDVLGYRSDVGMG